jgi:hypothetical protein
MRGKNLRQRPKKIQKRETRNGCSGSEAIQKISEHQKCHDYSREAYLKRILRVYEDMGDFVRVALQDSSLFTGRHTEHFDRRS